MKKKVQKGREWKVKYIKTVFHFKEWEIDGDNRVTVHRGSQMVMSYNLPLDKIEEEWEIIKESFGQDLMGYQQHKCSYSPLYERTLCTNVK